MENNPVVTFIYCIIHIFYCYSESTYSNDDNNIPFDTDEVRFDVVPGSVEGHGHVADAD